MFGLIIVKIDSKQLKMKVITSVISLNREQHRILDAHTHTFIYVCYKSVFLLIGIKCAKQ